MATAAPNRCPTCGAELPADAPRGLCPRCLLREGLDGDALSLSCPGELGATVDLGGPRRAGDARRHRRPGAARPAPRHRPRRRAARRRPAARDAAADPSVRLPDRRRDRPRRHGRRAQGPRPRPRPRRGRQGPARRPPREPRPGPPVRRGGPDRRPAPAPGHRADLRAGHLRRPPAVLLDEAGQGPDPRRAAGRPAARRPTACRGSWASSSRSARRSPTPTPAA